MVMTLMVMTEHGELANGHDVMRVMTINGHDEDTMVCWGALLEFLSS